MGIDIYLKNKLAERRRETAIAKFTVAAKLRDSLPKDSIEAKAAQELVSQQYESAYCAANGYLRSSYNSAGLFSVLDRIFGTDTGALLFPGDWDSKAMKMDWPKFVADVERMKAAAACLKHGDPLPVRFDELAAAPSKQRAGGEALGRAVMTMLTDADFEVKSGADGQHGFYNADDYEWYITHGLDELAVFGKLGLETNSKVTISY